jgi:hypothetical protein
MTRRKGGRSIGGPVGRHQAETLGPGAVDWVGRRSYAHDTILPEIAMVETEPDSNWRAEITGV